MFIEAESFVSPPYFNSPASCLRCSRLLSTSSSFIRSTIERRQSSFCGFAAASWSITAATSTSASAVETGATGAPADASAGAGAMGSAGRGSAGLALPKILLTMLPKMLMLRVLPFQVDNERLHNAVRLQVPELAGDAVSDQRHLIRTVDLCVLSDASFHVCS